MSESKEKPRVGVSSCLLGELVRYDGKEKRVAWVSDVLAAQVDLVSICPEVGAGMSVPRPAIQIVEAAEGKVRLQVVGEGRDVTGAMQSFIDSQLAALAAEPIDGYVFKARSPSCGLRDTPYFPSAENSDEPTQIAAGMWARGVAHRFSDLPMVDERDLQEEAGRERFLEAVREHRRRRLE